MVAHSRTMRSLSLATLALVLAAACADPAAPSLPAPASLTSMEDAARTAEATLGVPADLLLAMAWVETRWQRVERDDHAHGPPALGVVGLRPWLDIDPVSRATEALGVDAERIDQDPVTGVLAAALAMRALADARYGSAPPADPAAWAEIVGDYAGLEDYAREAHIDDVMSVLRTGLRATDPDGRVILLRARPIVVPRAVGVAREYGGAEYPSARWSPASTSNYTAGRSGESIRYVVIHTTQGSYAGAISWFRNPSARVSAHYVLRSSDGEVTQMLAHANTGWHAGNSTYNRRSIGIEHEGFVADPGRWYTTAMYESSARLTRWICERHGIPMDRAHIIGHVEVPGATHTDPGTGWDWARYMRLVTGTPDAPAYAATFTGSSIPETMTSGERAVAWVELRNEGTAVWRLDRTFLGAADDMPSPFFDAENWVNDHRSTPPDHSGYGRGDVGRFTFMITAPEVTEETVVSDTFRLVEEGVTWFGDEMTISIRVSPRPVSGPVDADGDGATNDVDCDDADPARYPGAAETCEDSIDQDCDGADAVCSPDPGPDAGTPSGGGDAGAMPTMGPGGARPHADGCAVGAVGRGGSSLVALVGLALLLARRRR